MSNACGAWPPKYAAISTSESGRCWPRARLPNS